MSEPNEMGSPLHKGLRRFKKDPKGVGSLLFLCLILFGAFFSDFLSSYSPEFQDSSALTVSPSTTHWLGTDSLGRDLFSRILSGSRVSMAVAFITAISGVLLGCLYGGVSGWLGGGWDLILMRLVELFYTLPTLLLMIFLNALFGSGITGMLFALSLEGMLTVARLVRGQVLQLKETDFIAAAHALGASDLRILYRHLLPNLMGPIIVTLTFLIPANIMYEAFLSFIGLGVEPPMTSWGTLANEGWRGLLSFPHLIIFPGFVIFVTIVCFNFLGDSIRDAFDPKGDFV